MSNSFDLPALEARLRRHVAQLAQTPRPPGSREHRRAQEYIADHLQQAGFAVSRVRHEEAGFECINYLTAPLPADDRLPLVIIGAHYDSVPDSPGADDNASAVAALIELAHWVGPRLRSSGAFPARLQLAAFDLEEYGMIGSYLHAQGLSQAGASVGGMIALEMLGYTDPRPGGQKLPPHLVGFYPDVGNFIGVCGNERSQGLLRAVVAGMKGVAGLPVEFLAVPGNGELLREVRLSDHSPFWDFGYEALMITDTSFFRNPHYHQPTDTPETLDYPFLAKVTAGVCAAVMQALFR
ncbi:MAG TPA: M28 family peptidase [Gemmataceae bacterium]|nr:M28 family peptidase [Gemmataceae bacterium]